MWHCDLSCAASSTSQAYFCMLQRWRSCKPAKLSPACERPQLIATNLACSARCSYSAYLPTWHMIVCACSTPCSSYSCPPNMPACSHRAYVITSDTNEKTLKEQKTFLPLLFSAGFARHTLAIICPALPDTLQCNSKQPLRSNVQLTSRNGSTVEEAAPLSTPHQQSKVQPRFIKGL